MPGERITDKSSSSCLSSNRPAREDGGSTYVIIAGAVEAANRFTVSVSTSCAPVASAMGAPMPPPIATAAKDDHSR